MFFIPFGTREHISKQRFPFITILLVLINVAVFAYQLYLGLNFGESELARFVASFATVPADVTDGTPLEVGLFTSMFLHAGFLHIASNMIYLLPFGDNIEDRIGHFKYLLFYLLCGLIASIVHIIVNPDSGIPAVGASGAIAGVLAGYLVLYPGGTVRGLVFIIILLTKVELPAIIFIGFWFFTQLFSGVASLGATEEAGGVAFWAHIGGFIAGLVLAPIFKLISRSPAAQAD